MTTTGWDYLDAPSKPIPFAHRGGAYHPEIEGLENTLEAFRHAVELGYDYLETDVHLTSDGVLLAFHDEVLDRVTDVKGAIKDLTFTEIQRARIGGRAQVPRFVDLLDEFPTVRFNVDVKSVGASEALADLIDERGLHDRILVGSFSRARLDEFRTASRGRVPTSAHPLEVAAFVLLPSGRLADRVTRGRVACLQIPPARGPLRLVTRRLVQKMHAVAKQVHVWTIDEADEMHRLLDLGVDALMTDRTDILKSVLIERGQWRGGR